ncbi:MAG TPA: copper amine oxidase N-terminal domain-containing protein, partial [Chthonomonadaceae bacterium]|nr:copper amine oxidase N-terminal domain-containing protein [Chthonomonadaceae bacterium]
LALINFPPYTYNWDSTRVPNGIHTLGVEAYDGDTLAKVKAHSLQIRVNNPGGFTHRQNDTPDLSRPGKKAVHPPTVALPTARPPAATGLPNALLEVKGNGAGLSLGARDPLGDLNTRHAGQPRGTYSTRSLPHIANIHRDRPVMAPNTGPSHTPVSAQPFSLTVRSIKPALKALLAGPDDLAGLHVAAPGASLAHQSVRPLRAGNIAVRPSTGLRPAVAAAPTAPRKAVAVTPRSPKAQIGIGSLLNIPGGTFEVAFDDTRIAFDVPPRVEHGLPLAPFRQIFEHTGGKVSWFSKAKLVRAVNDTREIEIKIGNAKAKVNNQTVQMEARPYIDRGRTIVPLSFIRDALDVNVQYDPQTGRMLIERK